MKKATSVRVHNFSMTLTIDAHVLSYRSLHWLKHRASEKVNCEEAKGCLLLEEVSGAVEISQLRPWIKWQHFEKTYLSASSEQTHHSEEKPLILHGSDSAQTLFILFYTYEQLKLTN